jgi:hypothetical protein
VEASVYPPSDGERAEWGTCEWAKVESGVAHAKKTPLKGQRFESLEEAQA